MSNKAASKLFNILTVMQLALVDGEGKIHVEGGGSERVILKYKIATCSVNPWS